VLPRRSAAAAAAAVAASAAVASAAVGGDSKCGGFHAPDLSRTTACPMFCTFRRSLLAAARPRGHAGL
jgi:hypothetical protein